MHRFPLALLLPLLVPCLALPALADDARRIALSYRVAIGPVPAGAGPVHVFLPVPLENEHQRVESLEVEASIPGAIESEPVYGNRFWHGSADAGRGETIEVALEAVVDRSVFHRDPPATGAGGPLDADERARFARFLGPNARVVVSHEMLDPILAEIRAASPTGGRPARARTIYDWVVDNLEYKKVGTGWGNGDTFWACSERYGNCTDFHALFISLARTEGIPARFEIGLPVPEDRAEGTIGGYHCWVEFYLDETGWVPIDASEAFKHPEKRGLFYGTHPADRIHFTTGRDLELGEDHHAGPLNYFIYPHVEVGGKAFEGPVERDIRFRVLGPAPAQGADAG